MAMTREETETHDRLLSGQIVQQLEQHVRMQLVLCDALEAIADALPAGIGTQNCLHVAQSIYPIVKSAHEFEEASLFPAIEKHVKLDIREVLERLHTEHWTDESYGSELADALKDYVAGRDRNAEKLGYMLRGFFEGLRRHIAFERELLAPLLSRATA